MLCLANHTEYTSILCQHKNFTSPLLCHHMLHRSQSSPLSVLHHLDQMMTGWWKVGFHQHPPSETKLEVELHVELGSWSGHWGTKHLSQLLDSLVQTRFRFNLQVNFKIGPSPIYPPLLFIIPCSQNNLGLFLMMFDFCKLIVKFPQFWN